MTARAFIFSEDFEVSGIADNFSRAAPLRFPGIGLQLLHFCFFGPNRLCRSIFLSFLNIFRFVLRICHCKKGAGARAFRQKVSVQVFLQAQRSLHLRHGIVIREGSINRRSILLHCRLPPVTRDEHTEEHCGRSEAYTGKAPGILPHERYGGHGLVCRIQP